MGFHPTDYVDITAVREKKKAALLAHRSQNGEEIYRKHHEVMENFRGREAGILVTPSPPCCQIFGIIVNSSKWYFPSTSIRISTKMSIMSVSPGCGLP
jgi:hypothetical protein